MNKKKKHKQGIAVPSWLKQFLRLVEGLSPELGMRVAAHIFSKPLKFKLPEKERKALKHCQSEGVKIQEINETIRSFEWKNKGKRYFLPMSGAEVAHNSMQSLKACTKTAFM